MQRYAVLQCSSEKHLEYAYFPISGIARNIQSQFHRALPTRPSTGLPSKVAAWCAGRQPTPPWWKETTTSVSPPSPGLPTSHLPAPSLWLYCPTHLGSLCNTATENLVDTTKNTYILSHEKGSLTLVWKVEACEEIDAVLQSRFLAGKSCLISA